MELCNRLCRFIGICDFYGAASEAIGLRLEDRLKNFADIERSGGNDRAAGSSLVFALILLQSLMIPLPSPQEVLQSVWGYDRFRGNQAEIVEALCRGRDALVVMPTGGGKSICFQVPGLVRPGLAIVVSPLIALMENQVQALQSKSVAAALLHSQLDRETRQQILYRLRCGKLKFLYLSPETLMSEAIFNQLATPDLVINSLIIDEAHCLVQWGDHFRPIYLKLGQVRDRLLQGKHQQIPLSIAAFTATANSVEQHTIEQSLQLVQPDRFIDVPYRPNLHLMRQRVWTPRDRRTKLLNFIRSQSMPQKSSRLSSGIVYVRTRQDAGAIAQWLNTQQISAAPYHAGLTTANKRQVEADWMDDRICCVVATSAFGMGVDKPDVRWVVQYQPPFWLSEYVQEVGRAGRDGKPAIGLTLVSERSGMIDAIDHQTWKNSISQLQKHLRNHLASESKTTIDLVKAIPAESEVKRYLNDRRCRWVYIQQFFAGESRTSLKPCGHCDRCSPSR